MLRTSCSALAVAVLVMVMGMVAMSRGEPYLNGLRVRFGFDLTDPETFQAIPRTLSEALDQGWTYMLPSGTDGKGQCENQIGEMKFHGTPLLKNSSDLSLVSLYDSHGIISGLQAYIPKDEIVNVTQGFFRYDLVPMIRNVTVNGREYFVTTAHFIQPSTTCSSDRNETSLQLEGTARGLWLQNGSQHDDVEVVPPTRNGSFQHGYTEDPCMDFMGFHGWYNFSTTKDCTDLRPIFVYYSNEGTLQGFGFTYFAVASAYIWEHPPVEATRRTIKNIPTCLDELNQSIGITGLHVYLFDKPQEYTCPPEENGQWARSAIGKFFVAAYEKLMSLF